MTTDDEHEVLAQALSRLSVPELLDVMRRVVPTYAESDGAMESRLFLAQVAWEAGDPPTGTAGLRRVSKVVVAGEGHGVAVIDN
jgi:hypothetical protein